MFDFSEIFISRERMKESRDCTVRATAVILGINYPEAHAHLKSLGRKNRHGFCFPEVADAFKLETLPELACKKVSACLKEIPKSGTFVVKVRSHVFPVVDGIPFDLPWPGVNINNKIVQAVYYKP
jgi:hypothetical protein